MPGGEGPIRVVVADHRTMVAEALSRALAGEADIEVVAVAESVAAAVAGMTSGRADVALIAEDLPDGPSANPASEIRRMVPEARVVLLAAAPGPASLQAAVDAGCVGLVAETEKLDRLPEAVRAAAGGTLPVPLGALESLLRDRTTARPAGTTLTLREHEVLGLVAEGLSNQAVADRLGIELNTVRTHLSRAIAKLGAHSKLEAVARARRGGLLQS